MRKSASDDPDTIAATQELAECYRIRGNLEPAELLCRQALEQEQRVLGPDHPNTLETMDLLGLIRTSREEYDDAEGVLRECLRNREKALPEHWSRFNTESLLGGCLLGHKKYAEAETHLLAGYYGMKIREKSMLYSSKHRLSLARERLVQLYDAWGKKGKADEWRGEHPPTPAAEELPADPFAGT